MKRRIKKYTILILSVFFYFSFAYSQTKGLNIDKGVAYIKQGTLNKKNISLYGQWEFYPNELLAPSDFSFGTKQADRQYILVPDAWNNHTNSKDRMKALGYATYRLQIIHHCKSQKIGIASRAISSASLIFIDGKKLAELGKVAASKEMSEPEAKPQSIFFTPKSDTTELIIQVANFYYGKGGITREIKIGTEANIKREKTQTTGISLFLIGAFVIMGLYHLGLFLLRKRNIPELFFGLLSLIIAARVLLTGDLYILNIFPNLSWELRMHLEYLTFYSGVLCFFLFIYFLYKKLFYKPILYSTIGLIGAYMLILFASSVYVFSKMLISFQVLTLLLVIYVLIIFVKAIIQKEEGAWILFTGFMIISATFINDSLYFDNIIQSIMLIPYGLFIFIFLQAYMLSKRFVGAYVKTEELSLELNVLNKELEKKVQERTKALHNTTKQLKHKEQRLHSIIENQDASILIVDLNDKVTFGNTRIFKYFGIDKKDAIGLDISTFLSAEDKRFVDSELERRKEGKEGQYNIRVELKGKKRTLQIYGSPDFSETGEVIGRIAVVRDITSEIEKNEYIDRMHQELKDRKAKYELVLESIVDIIFLLDLDGKILFVNKKLEEVFGFACSGTIGCNFKDLIPESEYENLNKHIKRIIKKGKTGNFRSFVSRKENILIPIEINGRLIQEHNEPRILLSARDISKRIRAEKAFAQSERKFRTLVENQSEGVTIVDVDDKFTFANPVAEKILGVKPGELIGKSLHAFLSYSAYKKVQFKNSQMKPGKKETYELKIIQSSGEFRHLLVSVTPYLNSEKEIIGSIGVFMDITERKRNEDKIKESETRYKLAENAANIGTWEWRILQNKTFWSDTAYKIFDLEKNEEYWGKDDIFLKVMPPDEAEKLKASLNKAVNQNKNKLNVRFKAFKNKKPITVDLFAQIIRDENNMARTVFGVFQDITKRVKAEQALVNNKRIIEKSYEDIRKNLSYAQRIQKGLIPKDDIVNNVLKNYFLLFKPKDIVGGDLFARNNSA